MENFALSLASLLRTLSADCKFWGPDAHRKMGKEASGGSYGLPDLLSIPAHRASHGAFFLERLLLTWKVNTPLKCDLGSLGSVPQDSNYT